MFGCSVMVFGGSGPGLASIESVEADRDFPIFVPHSLPQKPSFGDVSISNCCSAKCTHRGGLTPSHMWGSLLFLPTFLLDHLSEIKAYFCSSLSVLSLHHRPTHWAQLQCVLYVCMYDYIGPPSLWLSGYYHPLQLLLPTCPHVPAWQTTWRTSLVFAL